MTLPTGPGGAGIPTWVRIAIALVGIAIVVHEIIVPDEPRWLAVVTAMVMMGLVTPDIFDRWKRGPS